LARKKGKGWLAEFLERRNYYVSGALILIIYPVIYYYINADWNPLLPDEDPTPLKLLVSNVIHVMPALAVILFVMGFFDGRRREADDRELKKKRYEVRMELSRIEQREGGPPPRKRSTGGDGGDGASGQVEGKRE